MGGEQFGVRKGKGTRDAIGLLKTIGERLGLFYILILRKHLIKLIGAS